MPGKGNALAGYVEKWRVYDKMNVILGLILASAAGYAIYKGKTKDSKKQTILGYAATAKLKKDQEQNLILVPQGVALGLHNLSGHQFSQEITGEISINRILKYCGENNLKVVPCYKLASMNNGNPTSDRNIFPSNLMDFITPEDKKELFGPLSDLPMKPKKVGKWWIAPAIDVWTKAGLTCFMPLNFKSESHKSAWITVVSHWAFNSGFGGVIENLNTASASATKYYKDCGKDSSYLLGSNNTIPALSLNATPKNVYEFVCSRLCERLLISGGGFFKPAMGAVKSPDWNAYKNWAAQFKSEQFIDSLPSMDAASEMLKTGKQGIQIFNAFASGAKAGPYGAIIAGASVMLGALKTALSTTEGQKNWATQEWNPYVATNYNLRQGAIDFMAVRQKRSLSLGEAKYFMRTKKFPFDFPFSGRI